jgi:hypothetical protein
MLASGKPRFPFCVCWANENWTRRWDGREHVLLMEQRHSHEDDARFIETLLPAFRDPRYITVNGKPLLIIYYTDLMPDPIATSEIWRTRVRVAGFPDLFLVRAETHTPYGHHPDPRDLGFDAAVEFPPHGFSPSLRRLRPADPTWRADSFIFDYQHFVQCACARTTPDYRLFRSVMPSWDNSARREHGAYIYAHASPKIYGQWLADSIAWTRRQHTGEEQFVFINAWNEWAEGCHLEPDQRYGHQYLEATRTALIPSDHRRVVNLNRDEVLNGDTDSQLVPAPRSLDAVLAEYLLTPRLRFGRPRKAIYDFLKPIWRKWLALTSRG